MAVGRVASSGNSVGNGSYLDIKPTGTDEWVVQNIFYDQPVEFYFSNGSINIKYDSDTGAGAQTNQFVGVTTTWYLRVKNVSGSAAANIGYSGYVSN